MRAAGGDGSASAATSGTPCMGSWSATGSRPRRISHGPSGSSTGRRDAPSAFATCNQPSSTHATRSTTWARSGRVSTATACASPGSATALTDPATPASMASPAAVVVTAAVATPGAVVVTVPEGGPSAGTACTGAPAGASATVATRSGATPLRTGYTRSLLGTLAHYRRRPHHQEKHMPTPRGGTPTSRRPAPAPPDQASGSHLLAWAATRALAGHDTARHDEFTSPDSPRFVPVDGGRQAGEPHRAVHAHGLGGLDVRRGLSEEKLGVHVPAGQDETLPLDPGNDRGVEHRGHLRHWRFLRFGFSVLHPSTAVSSGLAVRWRVGAGPGKHEGRGPLSGPRPRIRSVSALCQERIWDGAPQGERAQRTRGCPRDGRVAGGDAGALRRAAGQGGAMRSGQVRAGHARAENLIDTDVRTGRPGAGPPGGVADEAGLTGLIAGGAERGSRTRIGQHDEPHRDPSLTLRRSVLLPPRERC
ncbi:hypothetical protein FMEAI12_5500032 [Parafrankia sp. Ea1.12]|nr:hypothetical protein FMEAI12_5500032 [Parafrankia sp. Ea1.12]